MRTYNYQRGELSFYMKILMLNGSPNERGCTFTALDEMRKAFDSLGVEHELLQIGKEPVPGCVACGSCRKTGYCFRDDLANRLKDAMKTADAFVVGSPVYYASPNGSLIALLDRMFYMHGDYANKPGAAVVSCRRGGATASLDALQKYFIINGMPIAASTYWPMVHGNTPDEVREDKEGLQIMRVLAHNLVYMARCFEAGKKAGILPTYDEKRIYTNFVR